MNEDGEAPGRRRTPARLAWALARTAVTLGALGGAVFLGLTTLSADAGSEPARAAATPTTTTTIAAATTTTVAGPAPLAIRPAPAGSYELTVTDCRQNGPDLRFWGSIRNLGAGDTGFRVHVTATDPTGGPLLTGTTDTDVVPAGETGSWLFRTSWSADLPALGASCVASAVDALVPGG